MFKIMLPKIDLRIERWKWNKEYRIYVSTLGHIKDEYRKNLPIKIMSNGYCKVNTRYGLKSIHRLVMLTFKPIPNAESLTVDHLNHNKRDNSLNNLEWVTKEENERRANRDYIRIEEKSAKVIDDIDKEVEKIAKRIRKNQKFVPNKKKIKNKIIKSIETGTTYFGYFYKLK